jgi:hypothetical protein
MSLELEMNELTATLQKQRRHRRQKRRSIMIAVIGLGTYFLLITSIYVGAHVYGAGPTYLGDTVVYNYDMNFSEYAYVLFYTPVALVQYFFWQGQNFFWLGVVAVAYFVPTIVAYARGHRQKLAITMLNIFGGWTIIGWVIPLAWASTTDLEQPQT